LRLLSIQRKSLAALFKRWMTGGERFFWPPHDPAAKSGQSGA